MKSDAHEGFNHSSNYCGMANKTRRFAKQVQLNVHTDFVVDKRQLPIVQPPGTYNITVGV